MVNSNITDTQITAELLQNLPDKYQKNVGEFACPACANQVLRKGHNDF